MSWYRSAQHLRRQGLLQGALYFQQWGRKWGINIRLPDSWFVLMLTISLALATWWLQQYISQLPLWQQVSQRQITMNMDSVIMADYREGAWSSFTTAEKMSLKSRQASLGQQDIATYPYEHWDMTSWQSWYLRDPYLYFIKAPQAQKMNEKQLIRIEGGLQVFGFNEVGRSKLPSTLAGLSPLLSPIADLSLTTSSADFHEDTRMLYMPDLVYLTLQSHRIEGSKLTMNLNNSRLTLEQVRGEMFSNTRQ